MWFNPILADLENEARAHERRRAAERRQLHSLALAARRTEANKSWLGRFVSSLSLGGDRAEADRSHPQTASGRASEASQPC